MSVLIFGKSEILKVCPGIKDWRILKRYEKKHGLPLHHLDGKPYVCIEELNEWAKKTRKNKL